MVGIFALAAVLHAVRLLLGAVPGVRPLSRWLLEHYHGMITPLARRVMVDPRNAPILAAVISLAATALPIFIAQLVLYEINWWLVLAFYAVVFGPNVRAYVRSFSALHQEGHHNGLKGRSPYEQACGSSFFYAFLCVVSGLIPHAVGHTQQHHRENGTRIDAFASHRYDHANLWHFFRYMTRDVIYQQFMVTPYLYFKSKGKHTQAAIMIKGNIVYFAVLLPVAIYSWEIALWYMLVPWGASNFLSGVIHWVQHAFYGGRRDYDNFLTHTITLKEAPVNFLNEGYHLCHHHSPGLHWTESPELFERLRDDLKAADSMVFRDLGVTNFFLLLTVFRAFGVLARKYEPWEPMTHEEKIAHIKLRAKPAGTFADNEEPLQQRELEGASV
ncbi:hypothetical protein CAI21_10645 [Alkalilimnicola ehrlichii]|uniref:Fatty acid desaturase domain-containing protein n=2 Tax=Alkalilimnicola ehrlichii TaxID=351052 RepID=A0A3E0WT27_9GAMM|nr:fatty acid desaturase [Alkalilimnicola ehrlichii]RFA29217.1 hypothetical protein CAI21_10645 [Alkalilimnicola ehrlichii]RFA36130.1 hypothetical protein CAL65_11795 [Alkalilimnicola ehrlichii]